MATKAKTLREMRIAKRLTQADVAHRWNVSQSYYSLVERGQKPADISEATKIVNMMRPRRDRTSGGEHKVGRQRS